MLHLGVHFNLGAERVVGAVCKRAVYEIVRLQAAPTKSRPKREVDPHLGDLLTARLFADTIVLWF
jgi:hypothetical protein